MLSHLISQYLIKGDLIPSSDVTLSKVHINDLNKGSDRFDEEQADDEVDNYKWIMDNKTNLPPESIILFCIIYVV